MAFFFIFHTTNIAILCYRCVNKVLNIRIGDAFFEKMAGIFGGRKWYLGFLKKGEAPTTPPVIRHPVSGHPGARAFGIQHPVIRHQVLQAPGHSEHIYFPLENIYVEHSFARLKYQSKNNNINLYSFNIL